MADQPEFGPEGHQPDFGPEGHLPERASRRARKIVLRAPMGVQWIVGAVVAGVFIVGAGLLWLVQSDDPPPSPWAAILPIAQLGDSHAVADLDILIVATGRPRAFSGLDDLGLEWCSSTRQIEGSDGRVWSATGRAHSPATMSLSEHPTLVTGGILYVDPTVTAPGPEPEVTDPAPACAD